MSFKIAQASANIWATFVRKFCRLEFLKIVQSGHSDYLPPIHSFHFRHFFYSLCILALLLSLDFHCSVSLIPLFVMVSSTMVYLDFFFVLFFADQLKMENGPWWWWLSSQRARLLLWWSEFESLWSLQFFCKICVLKRTKLNKTRGPGWPIF